MEADDNADEQHNAEEEDAMNIPNATIESIKKGVCQCLNKNREDDMATTIFSRCEHLVSHDELVLEDNLADTGYSLKDLHIFHMATSLSDCLGRGRQMSFRLRAYLTRLMCMKTEYPPWPYIKSYRNYVKFNSFFWKSAEGSTMYGRRTCSVSLFVYSSASLSV